MLHSVQVYLDRELPVLNKAVTTAVIIAMLNINNFRKYVDATKFKVRGDIKRTAKIPEKLLNEFLKESNIPHPNGRVGVKTLLVSLAVQYCIDKYPRFLYVISLLSSKSSSSNSFSKDEIDIEEARSIAEVIISSNEDKIESIDSTSDNAYDNRDIVNKKDKSPDTDITEDLVMKWWWGMVVPYHVRKRKRKSNNKYRYRFSY